MGHKGPEFVHDVPTVTKRSKSITIQYLRRVIHFSSQFLNITKSWYLPIPYLHVVTSSNPNFAKVLIRTPRTNRDKRIKITIYRNFEVNILTSKYRFHKFWNFNFSLILLKIRSEKIRSEKVSNFAHLLQKVIEGLNFTPTFGW